MNIAYLYHINNPVTFAGRTVANGFKNSFIEKGYRFRFFDTNKLKSRWAFIERLRLLRYEPGMIFLSMEDVELLPKHLNADVKLVIWGQFYRPCNYEQYIHHIQSTTKRLLQALHEKHDILIWSQHDDLINEQFFSGYVDEMGIKFVQLLHAADSTYYRKASHEAPTHDFMWVGNIGHRQDQFETYIVPLKDELKNYLEFSESNQVNPDRLWAENIYSRSAVIPNIHTTAQVTHQILINERVFTASIQGGFQVCDNPLARKYFPSDALVIAEKPNDFIEAVIHYATHPAERLPYIQKMQDIILQNHTYHHRVETILKAFSR